ncbi:hypothetical protein TorRG33x02_183220 [Trema orientale]|uniref:Uncharacterized protein n=1 Tax=Trema orientale TaxID=63057 RepID=A0A2P5EJW8_TREOI|nr:hypothetical protein TorRG33x02_183220 [Trema orientale]
MYHQTLVVDTLRRNLHQPSLRSLIRCEVHGGKRRIHQNRSPIRCVECSNAFFPQDRLQTIPNPLVRTISQLQSLLHHVHWGKNSVARHRGEHTGYGVGS